MSGPCTVRQCSWNSAGVRPALRRRRHVSLTMPGSYRGPARWSVGDVDRAQRKSQPSTKAGADREGRCAHTIGLQPAAPDPPDPVAGGGGDEVTGGSDATPVGKDTGRLGGDGVSPPVDTNVGTLEESASQETRGHTGHHAGERIG